MPERTRDGSPSQGRSPHNSGSDELAKWDALADQWGQSPAEYELDLVEELAALLRSLRPPAERILEAGCGGGVTGLELAQRGFQVDLLDFSKKMIERARDTWTTQANTDLPEPRLIHADLFSATPESLGVDPYDCVFNAGVLEHYEEDEIVELLRHMGQLSCGTVIALVPNSRCPAYRWWRWRRMRDGNWPFGIETPRASLADLMEKAGLVHCLDMPLAHTWTQEFVRELGEASGEFVQWHAEDELPAEITGYLTCSIARVAPADSKSVPAIDADRVKLAVQDSWLERLRAELENLHLLHEQAGSDLAKARDDLADRTRQFVELQDRMDRETESLTGQIDALATRAAELAAGNAERDVRIKQLDEQLTLKDHSIHQLQAELSAREGLEADLAERQQELAALRIELLQKQQEAYQLYVQLDGVYRSTGWALLKPFYRLRHWLFPAGSSRERFGRAVMHRIRRMRHWFGRRWQRSRPAKPAPAVAPRSPVLSAVPKTPSRDAGRVTVVLPVYNHSDLLGDAVRSVLAQTYTNFELIVINDGSTDNVEAVLDEFTSHPQVRILTQSHQSLPKALTNAFRFAAGTYWTWTSADNLMHPEQLSRLVAYLENHPDAAMVYADYTAIDDRGQPLTDPAFRPHNRSAPDSPDIHLPRNTLSLNTLPDNFIGGCFLYRDWVGQLIGEYDPQLGVEDYDYWMRINALFPIEHLGTDEVLYSYRVHDNSLNARAFELGLPQAVERLMTLEAERKAWYDRPWTIHAGPAGLRTLRCPGADAHTLREWKTGHVPAGDDEKVLLILRPEELAGLNRAEWPADCCVAAWFGSDERAPYEMAASLRGLADVCFAPDAPTRDRLRLLFDPVVLAPAAADVLTKAVAFANNHTFYRSRRGPDERRTAPPTVHVPAGRPGRVLLQTDAFAHGGMEKVMLDVARSLQQHGQEPVLLVLKHSGAAATAAREAGLTMLSLPENPTPDQYAELLREHGISLVNAHHSTFGAQQAADAGIPFVQTLHNTYVWFSSAQIESYRRADRCTDAYICVSTRVAMYSDIRLSLPAAKMVILPNGIDPERLDRPQSETEAQRIHMRKQWGLGDDDFAFLNVASVYAPKAQRYIVAALKQLLRACPQARVVFAGEAMDPQYMDDVRQAVAKASLNDSVVFAGYHDDVTPLYWAADAFLLPSMWEGCSLALSEAVLAGLPVVATDVGAARNQVPPEASQIIDPPFASVVDLDELRIHDLLRQDHPGFISELTDAMQKACGHRTRVGVPPDLARRLDRAHAYAGYANLFDWMIQGGSPGAARTWLRETHPSIQER